jgi:hypothetical protein
VWEGQTRHLQYCDDPAVIDRAVWSIVEWFGRNLGPGRRVSASDSSPENGIVSA